MMANIAPVHLMKWIEEHKTLFSGPVANKEVFPESEFIYQIVRGPNARNDFHIDPGDEIFYQLKGDITVRCIDADGSPRDITVREGFGGPSPILNIGVFHVAAIGLVLTDEERLERSHDLPVERALFVSLHVRRVVPQAHGEAGVLVACILGQPATA